MHICCPICYHVIQVIMLHFFCVCFVSEVMQTNQQRPKCDSSDLSYDIYMGTLVLQFMGQQGKYCLDNPQYCCFIKLSSNKLLNNHKHWWDTRNKPMIWIQFDSIFCSDQIHIKLKPHSYSTASGLRCWCFYRNHT